MSRRTAVPALRPSCPACCFIVPPDVLKSCARDAAYPPATRDALRATQLETERLRALRDAYRVATQRDVARLAVPAADREPAQHLFDCQHRRTLPGRPVAAPKGDFAAVRDTTAKLVEFYRTVLGRNSIDGHGQDLASSLHYGVNYDNAFWNGQQMVYGDGDGQVFGSMFGSPDVIGHEITHGVTQFESALRYEGESGALNESLSDVVGAVFLQWLNGWDVSVADGWRVGAGILGPAARARGYACLRDLADPSAAHCLSRQPARYADIDPTADVHLNSGVPNRAFCAYAQALGGRAWDQALPVWYRACTGRRLRSDATFAEFAAQTVAAARALDGSSGIRPLRAAWRLVGVSA